MSLHGSDRQLLVFDPDAGRAAREAAMAQVAAHASSAFRQAALQVIWQVVHTHATFTADDIWRTLTTPTQDNRALGPALRVAQLRGWCAPTARTRKTDRVTNHRRPLTVWESALYQRSGR
jgi:alkylhydroperoxidase family enzyme